MDPDPEGTEERRRQNEIRVAIFESFDEQKKGPNGEYQDATKTHEAVQAFMSSPVFLKTKTTNVFVHDGEVYDIQKAKELILQSVK